MRKPLATGSIYLRNRPVRTAYIVDTDVYRPGTPALDSVLDGITTYSINTWGARRDSIHFFSGATGFTDDEWDDLEDADPDRIYTFSPVSQGLLERLHLLRPWSIQMHHALGGDSPGNVPTLPGVPVLPTRESLAKHDMPLLLLAFTYECAAETRSFLHRNFGSYDHWSNANTPGIIQWMGWMMNLQKEGRHLQFKISYQDTVNNLFSSLAGNFQSGKVYRPPLAIIAPCEIASLSRPFGVSSWSWANGFHVFVGTSPQLFAAYWTDTRSSGCWTEPFRHRLWIPPTILSAPGFADALAMYLWQYSGLHSSNNRPITFISDDASHATVEASLPLLAQAPRPVPAKHRKLEDWEALRRQKRKRELQQEFVRPRLDSRSATRYRIYEDHQTFAVERPEAVMSPDATWAVEVQLQQDLTEGVAGRTNHVLLPKPSGSDIAPLMLHAPSRIDRNRLMVARLDSISGPFDRALPPELHVSEVQPVSVVRTMLSGRTIGFESDDLRKDRILSPGRDIGYSVSEPGKHLRGLIPLFGDLEQSRHYTDRKLWGKVFQYLSGTRIKQDRVLEAQVQNLLLKRLSPSMRGTEAEKLAETISGDTVRLVQAKTGDRYLTLARMHEWREEIASASGPDAVTLCYGSDRYGVNHAEVRPITKEEFEDQLAYLIERDVLHLGINLKCPSCFGQQWYLAKNLGQRVECAGCGHSYAMPPSPEWSYKLNSLARRAVPSGTFMVLQALRELADRATFSFYYSPSLDVWTKGGTTLAGELDLICLVNGELVLGEAKSGRPKRSEFERFQSRMLELRPDHAIVFVSQEFLEEARPLYESLRIEAEKHSIVPELFSLPSY